MLEKGLFEKCCDCDYQRSCVQLVIHDNANNGGMYFSEGNIGPNLTKERQFVFQVADDCLDTLNEQIICIA